ncbi:MAG: GntR family transcriptional regulator, partial [Steroidobacteraceae bacterium]
MSVEFEQIRIEPAYRKVAAALIERITDRSWSPGDRLPSELELARQFGVHRSTVREAMRELESSGLIGRERGSKLMVVTKPKHDVIAMGVRRALALHDVRYFDVWEALTFLEPPLAEAAARRRTDADLQSLQQAVQLFKNDNADVSKAVERVASFFRTLGEATHN